MAQAPMPTTDASTPDFPIFMVRIDNSSFWSKGALLSAFSGKSPPLHGQGQGNRMNAFPHPFKGKGWGFGLPIPFQRFPTQAPLCW
jgi:hypothetical protein